MQGRLSKETFEKLSRNTGLGMVSKDEVFIWNPTNSKCASCEDYPCEPCLCSGVQECHVCGHKIYS